MLFVSSMQTGDDCFPGDTPPAPPLGGPSAGDIFIGHEDTTHAWSTPVNLGCYPSGPDTAGAEFSPSWLDRPQGKLLFFSSNGYCDSQGQDIYTSRVLADGTVTAGERVAELSTAADERMPSVRADGLEIVSSSSRGDLCRHACQCDVALVGAAAHRQRRDQYERTETRSSLSTRGTRLYFGRKVDADDPGDVFVATRERIAAPPPASTHPMPGPRAPALAVLAALLAAGAWLARRAAIGKPRR